MRELIAPSEIQRLLVVIPNWVGDVVLATPVLSALREHFRAARISYLMRPYVAEIVAGGGWHDSEIFWPTHKSTTEPTKTSTDSPGKHSANRELSLNATLRSGNFDAAILLTNSFRSAFATWLAGIPRRIGYARDGRSFLLTHRLRPIRRNGTYVPSPVLDYYCTLSEYAGCVVTNRKLRLGVTAEQEAAGAELKRAYGLDDGQPYAVINPGAAFGAAKCWLPERFAEACDEVSRNWGMRPVLVGAGNEKPLMREIAARATAKVVCCDNPGTTLGSLKPLVRDAALLICNDTGPRHYGAAFDIPTVTIFGPTHMEWTDTDYAGEVKLQIPVDCGPCQLRTCPLDHRCMTGISTEMVISAADSLLTARRTNHASEAALLESRP